MITWTEEQKKILGRIMTSLRELQVSGIPVEIKVEDPITEWHFLPGGVIRLTPKKQGPKKITAVIVTTEEQEFQYPENHVLFKEYKNVQKMEGRE